MKTCSKCKEEKSVEEFHKRKASKDGLRPDCKSCVNTQSKAHYYANHQLILERRKGERDANPEGRRAYYQLNRKSILDQRKTHYNENRQAILQSNIGYERERLKLDPAFRIIKNIRRNLHHILKGKHNHAPTLELLGCTGEEWRSHLESTFKSGMTWGNYGQGEGKWQVDHIMPVSSFEQEDHLQRLICWNYRNTQALWSHENMAKGDTISTEGGAA